MTAFPYIASYPSSFLMPNSFPILHPSFFRCCGTNDTQSTPIISGQSILSMIYKFRVIEVAILLSPAKLGGFAFGGNFKWLRLYLARL